MGIWYDEIKTQPEPVVLLIFELGRKCHWGEQRESHCGSNNEELRHGDLRVIRRSLLCSSPYQFGGNPVDEVVISRRLVCGVVPSKKLMGCRLRVGAYLCPPCRNE